MNSFEEPTDDILDDWHFADVTTESFVDEEEEEEDVDENDSPPITKQQQQQQSLQRQNSSKNQLSSFDMPPTLHPAVSLGVRRVSSCYLSIGSQESMADLLSQLGDNSSHHGSTRFMDNDDEIGRNSEQTTSAINTDWIYNSEDVLYHDVLMQVFTYLDASSLASFSETARRPNFEVFYYLQLQLQQALLVGDEEPLADNQHHWKHHYSNVAGCSLLSRLKRLDNQKAQNVVEEYVNSNSTLRIMPLSHSLAYARRYLLHNGFAKMFPNNSKNGNNNNNNSSALASAALFMTVVGAASLVSTVSGGDATAITGLTDSFGSEIPNLIFGVGFTAFMGSAARQMSDTEQRTTMMESAASFMRGTTQREANNNEQSAGSPSQFRLPSFFEMKHKLQTTLSNISASQQDRQPVLSNPYDHLPVHNKEGEDSDEEKKEPDSDDDANISNASRDDSANANRKMPSGCVGAYSRAIHKSVDLVKGIVKESRKVRFNVLSEEEQRQLSLDFLAACTSNEMLGRVKEMIQTIEANDFFLGSDGSETCALHTAAFNGADQVVDFLCSGIDDTDPQRDGGLCDVNCKDNNGWTALHFAAGANSVPVVRVLVKHGAALQVEAHNGYSPFQWAVRLSNEEVAKELTDLLSKTETDGAWMSSQPLTSIANRFFALIPSH